MEITEVRLRRAMRDSKVLAHASIVFDGKFVVHDLRIINGAQGAFVSMPSRRTQSGDYLDVAHPLTAEYREQVQRRVLAAYESWLRGTSGAGSPQPAVAQAPVSAATPAPEAPVPVPAATPLHGVADSHGSDVAASEGTPEEAREESVVAAGG